MSLEPGQENSSGQPDATLPQELQGLNWGAFLLNWIWCIPHRAWLGLILSLICTPIGPIYLLIKGNEDAWKNRRFSTVQEFRDIQSAWLKWGLIVLIASVGLAVVGTVLGILIAASAARSGGGGSY